MRRFLLSGPAVLAVMLLLAACGGQTTGATNVTASSADLHASAHCDQGESCTWYWEYWPASQPRSSGLKTSVYGPVGPTQSSVALTQHLRGLQSGTSYRWVFCGSPNGGDGYACTGPKGEFDSTTADPPRDYSTFTTATVVSNWAITPAPSPGGTNGSGLERVSCTSATACTAVGSYDNGAGARVTLAERWDGSTWTVQPTPNPSGATFSDLLGVSCTSATACVAVGFSYSQSGNGPPGPAQTLVEHWDGTAWTIQSSPQPPGLPPSSDLYGVSCTSATACTAVGSYTQNAYTKRPTYLTLAERWDGSAWTIQSTPNPSGTATTSDLLSSVSCSSATACTAVGSANDLSSYPQTYMTLAEHWDGSTWTIQPTPAEPAGTQPDLSSVSCTSATACTAVGFYWNGSTQVTLAERWDGTAWTIQPTPNPPGTDPGLAAVSCTSATACTAVGSYGNADSQYATLAERWDGTSWTIQATPNPTAGPSSGSGASFGGVSCPSATSCVAVGTNYFGSDPNAAATQMTLAETYSQ